MVLSELDAAAKSNPSLRRVLQQIQDWMTGTEQAVGIAPLAPAQGGKVRQAPPPQATLAVSGADGRFEIKITLPAAAIGPMLHEIKYSETVPFASSTTVVTLPSTPDTVIQVFCPSSDASGIRRYFQMRSRYFTSDFNQPVVSDQVFSGKPAATFTLPPILADAGLGAPDSGGVGYKLLRVSNTEG
jgi:hypothetical protein